MSDHADALRCLLMALRQAGEVQRADVLEADAASRGWIVTPEELGRALAAVDEAARERRLRAPEAQQPRDVRQQTPQARPSRPIPRRFTLLATADPWVRTLPGEWQLVERVHGILTGETYGAACQALAVLCREHLGYEAHALDETRRLGETTVLSELMSVARHGEFHIIAVRSRYAGPHVTTLEPIFRLFPRALVFSFEPYGRIRVVARRPAGGDASPLTFRLMRGVGTGAAPDDDIVVWSRRLALLEPQPSDDALALAGRACEAVTASAMAIGRAWDSARLDGINLPGPSWEELPAVERDAFLQYSQPQGRLYWGLEAALRDSLTWTSDGPSGARVELTFRGYELVANSSTAEECTAGRSHSVATVQLRLRHRFWERGDGPERETDLLVDASVVVPDDAGVFVLHGAPMRFAPGRAVPAGEAPAEVEVPLAEEGVMGDAPIGMPDADMVEDAADVQPQWPFNDATELYRGASIGSLLGAVVTRKLGFIGLRFSQVGPERLATPGAVRAFLSTFSDSKDRLVLTATAVLGRHLEPMGPGHRTHVVSPDEPPPAWACLDMSAVLPVGRAYPIRGARLAPGGVLAAPVPADDGSNVRLSSRDSTAFECNPRITGRRSMEIAHWIASPLAPWASTRVGALARAAAAVPAAPVTATPVVQVRGDELVLLVDCAKLTPYRDQRTWWEDIPAHRNASTPPTLIVDVGADLQPGQPVAVHDGRAWTNAKLLAGHNLAKLSHLLTGSELGMDARPIRCPPSVAGRLLASSVSPLVNRHGDLIAYRVWMKTLQERRVGTAVLPDGRVVSVRAIATADLPFSEGAGTPAAAVLLDPDAAITGGSVPGWRDGRTGELLDGGRTVPWALLLPEAAKCGPDIGLGYRALDGYGHPRASHDPQVSVGVLRLIRSLYTHDGDILDRAAARPYGFPPVAATLFELAGAIGTSVPPLMPLAWRHVMEEGTPADPYDPVRTKVAQASRGALDADAGDDSRSHHRIAPWTWRCPCGAMRGAGRAFERCATCRDRVEPRCAHVSRTGWRTIPLPLPVLHPWRKAITAALLGLLASEFDPLLRACDASPLVEHVERAFGNPERSLIQRIQREGNTERRAQLTRALARLEPIHAGRLRADDLWLREVRQLPDRLLFDGFPRGAPDLLSSPLTSRYREVTMAAQQAMAALGFHLAPLRRSAWIQLQRAVDRLFGDPAQQPEAGTLVEILERVWPASTAADLPIAVAGLYTGPYSAIGRADDAVFMGARDFARAETEVASPEAIGVLAADGANTIAVPPPAGGDPTTATFWRERGAYTWLVGDGLSALAAICLGAGEVPSIRGALEGLMPHDMAPEALGAVVLREFLEAVRPPRGSPSAVRAMFCAKLPLTLPTDREAAMAIVAQRLRVALPEDTPGAEAARRALTLILAGFWTGSPSLAFPLGWAWSETADTVPPGYRRAVPRLHDAAWESWSGYRVFTNPVLAAAANDWGNLSRAHLHWLGTGQLELPERQSVAETAAASVAVPAHVSGSLGAPTVEIATSAERTAPVDELCPSKSAVAILGQDIATWFAARQSRGSNA